MKTKITYKKSKYHFAFITMLFTCFLFSLHTFSQKITTTLIENWESESWQGYITITNTYDDNNYLTTTLTQIWSTEINDWENFSLSTFTNNENGVADQVIVQTWNSETSTWVDSGRISNTYNASDQVLTSITDVWTGISWLPISKQTNTYNGGYLTNTLSQSSLTGSLRNVTQTDYTYNGNGTENESVTQTWNNVSWDNSRRTIAAYLGNKIQTKITRTWIAGNWKDFSKVTYDYDGSGYLINSLDQNWDNTNNDWINNSQINFSNNANGTVHQAVSQSWDDTGAGAWENVTRITYEYNQLGITDFITNRIFTVYPLPAQDRITIKSNEQIQALPYTIFDLTGRQYLTRTLNSEETTIDVNQLAIGVYLFQIGQNRNQTVKIIKR